MPNNCQLFTFEVLLDQTRDHIVSVEMLQQYHCIDLRAISSTDSKNYKSRTCLLKTKNRPACISNYHLETLGKRCVSAGEGKKVQSLYNTQKQ